MSSQFHSSEVFQAWLLSKQGEESKINGVLNCSCSVLLLVYNLKWLQKSKEKYKNYDASSPEEQVVSSAHTPVKIEKQEGAPSTHTAGRRPFSQI